MTKKTNSFCADAGLGSIIRSYNAMGGRAFHRYAVQKEIFPTNSKGCFHDFEYKLLSDETPVSIEAMKQFDKADPKNLAPVQGTRLTK